MEVKYEKGQDVLYIYFRENRPAISVDCDGLFWLRVDPQTNEIVGIEIEDFRVFFMGKHPEILKKLEG